MKFYNKIHFTPFIEYIQMTHLSVWTHMDIKGNLTGRLETQPQGCNVVLWPFEVQDLAQGHFGIHQKIEMDFCHSLKNNLAPSAPVTSSVSSPTLYKSD